MPSNAMSTEQAREFGNLIASAGDFLSKHDDLPQGVREIVADFESKARRYNREQSEGKGAQDRPRHLDDEPQKNAENL